MPLNYLLLVVGIFLLIKGADSLVDGSVTLSRKLGVSSLIVGLTVVSFGTSMPELIVNLFSGVAGETDIALGNIVGSNIANILLVLGLTSFIYPVKVSSSVIWKEIPFGLLAAIVLIIASNDKVIDFDSVSLISRVDGLLILTFFLIFIYYLFEHARSTRNLNLEKTLELGEQGYFKLSFLIIGGAILLALGGKLVVDSIINISQDIGLSKFFLSSTVIAAGTSLPEAMTSIIAAKKGKFGISVGNVVGSNIFNILFIMGITAAIFTVPVNGVFNLDMIFLIIVSVLFFVFMFLGKKHEIGHWKGLSFLILYALYILFNFYRG